MKKLMCAVATLVVGVAMAEITSANVVGYVTKTSRAGFNFYAPAFKNCSSTVLNVQDIKLSGDNVTDYTDNIQILDEGGATSHLFVWIPAEDLGAEVGGWANDEGTDLAEYFIKPGESILISTENEEVAVTFSGEVISGDFNLKSVAGFNFFGNATPVDIDVQSIKIAGADVTDYTDNIQILDDGGATEHLFVWIPAEDLGAEVGGWANDDGTDLDEYTVVGGEGILISTENADVGITIPGVKLAD